MNNYPATDHFIDSYKKVSDKGPWKKCSKCGELPWTWEFNNGRYAKCKCSEKYGEPEAMAESIMSFAKRNGMSFVGYPHDGLKKAWNKYVETGKRQKLEDGRW